MPQKNKPVDIVKYSISNVTEISIASSKTKSAATLNIIANKNITERMGSRAVIERTENATIIEEHTVQDKYWCASCYLKIQRMSDAKKHPTYEGEKIFT